MQDSLQQAIRLIRGGNKEAGRQLLIEILDADERNETAWLWMSAVVESDDLRRECLQEVLRLNPDHEAARRGLEKLEQQQAEGPTAGEPETQTGDDRDASAILAADGLHFKFRFVRDGQARGLFAKKGTATDSELALGNEILSYSDIVDTATRDNRLILTVSTAARLSEKLTKALVKGSVIAIEVRRANALELERHIDRARSILEAEKHRQRLAATGRDSLFRTITCPECESLVDLSELDETPYVYCPFCDTIFTDELQTLTPGITYRVCDECGLYGRIRGYTEFYFYFLLVVYGFSYKRRHVCDNCANTIFRRTLLLNLIFLIGIIPSILVKTRSLIGRDPALKELPKANALARKGHFEEAAFIYDRLYEAYPEHPGLLMNEGVSHLLGDDAEGASDYFRRALRACSNYLPVLDLMQRKPF